MNSPPSPTSSGQIEYDPTFLHSRREAIIIFALWVVTLLWTVPYCYFNGYAERVDPENLKTIAGIPSWVFWGVAMPWAVANLFSIWFCFCYMVDDDLGEANEGADIDEEVAEKHAADNARQQDQGAGA